MPVPYHRARSASSAPYAAYLLVRKGRSPRELLAGLLVIDGRGQPVEFVHNSLEVPSGFLWPEPGVEAAGSAALAHSLFEACRCSPDLLMLQDGLFNPDYLRKNVAPLIPTCVVTKSETGVGDEYAWVTEQPSDATPAASVLRELVHRGFLSEPFERIHRALEEIYLSESP